MQEIENEEEMETTDSGIEDLPQPAIKRTSSNIGDRLKVSKTASFREPPAAVTNGKPDTEMSEVKEKEKDRKRKQPSTDALGKSNASLSSSASSGRLPSLSTQGFSTQGSEYVAEDEEGGDSEVRI